MSLINLARDLGIFAITAVILAYLARQFISNYFDKELAAYRSELEQERIKFSELHETRGEVITELYEKLTNAEERMESLVSPVQMTGEPSKAEKMESAHKAMREFFQFYNRKKIYLPPEVCDDIDELFDEWQSIFTDFSIMRVHEDDRYLNSDRRIEKMDKWVDDWQSIKDGEVNQIKEELENTFRKLLGVRVD